MELVNLTNRIIRIVDRQGDEVMSIQPSGIVVSVSMIPEITETVQGVSVVKYRYSEVSELPEPKLGTVYIVSYAVLQALEGSRDDVVSPDTSPTSVMRNAHGSVLGVQRLRKI